MTAELMVQALVGGSISLLIWVYGRKMTQSIDGLRQEFHEFRIGNEHRVTVIEKDVEELKRDRQ